MVSTYFDFLALRSLSRLSSRERLCDLLSLELCFLWSPLDLLLLDLLCEDLWSLSECDDLWCLSRFFDGLENISIIIKIFTIETQFCFFLKKSDYIFRCKNDMILLQYIITPYTLYSSHIRWRYSSSNMAGVCKQTNTLQLQLVYLTSLMHVIQ